MSVGLTSLKSAWERSPEERKCCIALIISTVCCANESGSKLNSPLVTREAESDLKEIPNLAGCLPAPDYLPVHMRITASRVFHVVCMWENIILNTLRC